MRYEKLALVCLLGTFGLVPGAVQAQFIVVPPANAAANGNNMQYGVFENVATTFQFDYDAAQLSALTPGTPLTSIGFRAPGGFSNEPTSADSFASYQITLSQNNNSVSTLSTTFANNIGSDATQVYNAPLTIPANAFVGGPGPNPFYDILFSTPYVYNGGDLLVTLRYTGGGSAFAVDANLVGDGKGNTVGSFGSSTATSGQTDFYNYPIARFGVGTAAVPEPGSVAMLLGMGLTGAGFLLKRRR